MQSHENGYYTMKLSTLPGQLFLLTVVVHIGQVCPCATSAVVNTEPGLLCIQKKYREIYANTKYTQDNGVIGRISAALSPKCPSCMTNFSYAETPIAIFIHTTTLQSDTQSS